MAIQRRRTTQTSFAVLCSGSAEIGGDRNERMTRSALAYANSVLSRARRAGFDWDNPDTIYDKVSEELRELAAEDSQERREEELGDVLLAMVGTAVRMGVDPEQALRGANARFYDRFRHVEAMVRESGRTLAQTPTEEKLALWEQAKG